MTHSLREGRWMRMVKEVDEVSSCAEGESFPQFFSVTADTPSAICKRIILLLTNNFL
jgi:hypothetical protein